jgi:hypothetical protein
MIRTNLATNPSVETNATRWAYSAGTGGAGSGARSTATAGWVGAAFYRATWTTGTSAVNGGVNYTHAGITAGTAYTVSYYARPSVTQTLKIAFEWYDGASALISVLNGTPAAATANAWTRYSLTGTAPANAVTMVVSCYAATGGVNWSVGNTLDVDGLLIEATSTLGVYFDGDTAPVAGTVYAWTGTAHASTSTATIQTVTATPDPATARVSLALADGPVGQPYLIFRRDSSGVVIVRDTSAGTLLWTSGVNTVLDYEARQGLSTDYLLTDKNGTVTATVLGVVPPVWGSWLKSPGRPYLNVKVPVAALGDEELAARREVVNIQDSPLPVVLSEAYRSGAHGTVQLTVTTAAMLAAVLGVLVDGAVVMLDTDTAWGTALRYVSVGDVSIGRVFDSGLGMDRPTRVVTLSDVVAVAAPVGTSVARAVPTYAGLPTTYSIYATIPATKATYAALVA